MWKKVVVVLLMLFVFSGTAAAMDRVGVFVSILPQKTFVQRIGGDFVEVKVMVQPGASPATYEPKPRQMADLSKSRIYFAVGVPFEKVWLDKIAAANPGMKVVHTDNGIEKIPMAAHHHEEGEHHGDHGEGEHHHHEKGEHDHSDHVHEHAGLDPHIWLSPPLVKTQAHTMMAALQEVDPDHRREYGANFEKFAAEIDRLDRDLHNLFAGKEGLQFMVFHPAWGYFAHTYGLRQVPVEIEGKDPKPAQLRELIRHSRKSGIRVVFVQPQFSTKSAQLVAGEIGGQVAFADPLAEDWLGNMRAVAEKFRAALK